MNWTSVDKLFALLDLLRSTYQAYLVFRCSQLVLSNVLYKGRSVDICFRVIEDLIHYQVQC